MGVTKNFITTIRNSEQALEIGKDMGEVAIDAILSDKFGIDGVLKDVPILNIIVSLHKAGNKISAHFFAKNMLAFLTEINRVPNEKRIEFLNENCANEEGIENVGEVTLMILDKLDHPKLATMLGRAFALMTLGEIDKYVFDIYAHTIKVMNPYLLQQLKQCYQIKGMIGVDAPAATILANYALLKVGYKLNHSGNTADMDLSIAPTAFGELFYKRIVVGSDTY
ncbi:hypothetical protein K7459_12755 [Pseudomonas fluorescens]|uniref:Uncharacterized protein n=1 Tax=Pseudomonas fluorescens (strain Pf0-1) TaxID=205922 RepID=Q3KAG4_PSEPF|nr:hypothetical protein [Pseudomonas fluorescens]ABA75240.1 conserved hypothetical protein [Pseudomonas fluorescens Pf0-1]MBY9024536.1 hypothetical protein [Pseudomonas fluorescens]MBY9030949.1 hypothetical protein [Pseudomonas fluorescens]MBY9036952.1 hypothetical protein [Pseudomonas fluorescens]MBY9043058.1 hypothetical protein [Pseudomonas fluorescens]